MIKLKETVETTNKNKLNKIKVIASNVRSKLEISYDWADDKLCFKNMCDSVVKQLADEFSKYGIRASRVSGYYYGASDTYTPDMEDWDVEDADEYYDSIESGKPFGFTHWWVLVDNKYIVDIASDQFHPGEEDDFRVVITDINDPDYST